MVSYSCQTAHNIPPFGVQTAELTVKRYHWNTRFAVQKNGSESTASPLSKKVCINIYIYMYIFKTIQRLCQSVKSHRGSTISPACHKWADSASPKLAPALSHCSCSPRGRTGWHWAIATRQKLLAAPGDNGRRLEKQFLGFIFFLLGWFFWDVSSTLWTNPDTSLVLGFPEKIIYSGEILCCLPCCDHRINRWSARGLGWPGHPKTPRGWTAPLSLNRQVKLGNRLTRRPCKGDEFKILIFEAKRQNAGICSSRQKRFATWTFISIGRRVTQEWKFAFRLRSDAILLFKGQKKTLEICDFNRPNHIRATFTLPVFSSSRR